jgi:hypothetical protein
MLTTFRRCAKMTGMSKRIELEEALKYWRHTEREHAIAVLIANHPDHIRALAEPWADIANDL